MIDAAGTPLAPGDWVVIMAWCSGREFSWGRVLWSLPDEYIFVEMIIRKRGRHAVYRRARKPYALARVAAIPRKFRELWAEVLPCS